MLMLDDSQYKAPPQTTVLLFWKVEWDINTLLNEYTYMQPPSPSGWPPVAFPYSRRQ